MIICSPLLVLIIYNSTIKNISGTRVKLTGTNVQMTLFRNLERKKEHLSILEQILLWRCSGKRMQVVQQYARLHLHRLLTKLYWMLKIKLVSNLKLRKYWKKQLTKKIKAKIKPQNKRMKRKKSLLILKKSWEICESQ